MQRNGQKTFQCVDDMCRRGRSTRAAGSQGLQPYQAIFSSATPFPPIATRLTGFLATHFAIITRLSSILFRMPRSMGKHVFVARTPSDAFPMCILLRPMDVFLLSDSRIIPFHPTDIIPDYGRMLSAFYIS